MAVDRDTVKKLKKTVVEDEAPPPSGARKTIWDTEVKGFGLRVTSSGRRTYVLRYRMGGGSSSAPRTYTIGQHGSPWTVDQARRRALDLLTQVRSGVDPAEERIAARAAVETAKESRENRLFPVLADRWFRQHVVAGGLRSEKDIKGVLERDLKPALADVAVDEITKEGVSELIETIGDRSHDAANKAMKWLRQMLNWLVGKLKERVDELVGELVASSATAQALVGDGLAEWVVHDLRRSLTTGCQALGVPLQVTEATLNHASGSVSGVAGIYHLYEFYDEKAEALQRWADLIEAAVVKFRNGDAEGVKALDPARRKPRRRRRDPAISQG